MTGEAVLSKIVTEILFPIYQVVLVFAFLYFLWGVFIFLKNYNTPDEKNTGKQHMLWGMIGLFIMFSVGGILKFFTSLVPGAFQF